VRRGGEMELVEESVQWSGLIVAALHLLSPES
jgi:hypothetical protein